MYQEYKFQKYNRYYLKNNVPSMSYQCSEADSLNCKAYLRVNLAGDVLSAFIEHNHIPKPEEELEIIDSTKETDSTPGKIRCTKRQIQYLINFMLDNKDLATGVRNAQNRNKIHKKWQTLAINLATVGPWKSVQHLKATWRDLKKVSRVEIVQLANHAKSTDKCVPTERTCKVFEALGHPIDENMGPKELSDILVKCKPRGTEKLLANLFKHKNAKPRYVKQSSYNSDSKIDRCTKRQITFLIDYMVQNKELALETLKGSESRKKWQELETKMAAIGPWKSAKHLMGTWKEIKKYAKNMSIIAPGEERPKANTMKVINLMGLSLTTLARGETTAEHDYADGSHIASSEVETSDSDDDDSDSSGNWPIYEIDSYP